MESVAVQSAGVGHWFIRRYVLQDVSVYEPRHRPLGAVIADDLAGLHVDCSTVWDGIDQRCDLGHVLDGSASDLVLCTSGVNHRVDQSPWLLRVVQGKHCLHLPLALLLGRLIADRLARQPVDPAADSQVALYLCGGVRILSDCTDRGEVRVLAAGPDLQYVRQHCHILDSHMYVMVQVPGKRDRKEWQPRVPVPHRIV